MSEQRMRGISDTNPHLSSEWRKTGDGRITFKVIGTIIPRRHKSPNVDTDVGAAMARALLFGTSATTQFVFAKGYK